METELERLWTGDYAGSYQSPEKAFLAFRHQIPGLTRKHVRQFLSRKQAFNRFKPYRREVKSHKSHLFFHSNRPFQYLVMDTLWLPKMRGPFRCALICVDAFSRKCFYGLAKHMTSATASRILRGVILNAAMVPHTVLTDAG